MSDNAAPLTRSARAILESTDGASWGWRAHAVATLTRQQLESSLDEFWSRTEPSVAAANRWVQFLCLSSYTDPEVAGLASITWVSLSAACHARSYEVTPDAIDLERWVIATERVTELLSIA